jgi:hypothetical protein
MAIGAEGNTSAFGETTGGKTAGVTLLPQPPR